MLNTYLFAGTLLVYAIVAFFSLSSLVVPRLVPIFNNDNIISLVMLLLTTRYVALFFNAAFPQPTGLRGWRKVASTAWRWSKPLVFTIAFGVDSVVPYRFVLFLVCYWGATYSIPYEKSCKNPSSSGPRRCLTSNLVCPQKLLSTG